MKQIKVAFLALTFVVAFAQQSQAALIAGFAIKPIRDSVSAGWQRNEPGKRGMLVGLMVVTCILTLPVCLLGENSSSNLNINQNFLVENGYSPAEASSLVAEHSAVMRGLRTRGQVLLVEQRKSLADLASDIRTIRPNASNEYVEMLGSLTGLN